MRTAASEKKSSLGITSMPAQADPPLSKPQPRVPLNKPHLVFERKGRILSRSYLGKPPTCSAFNRFRSLSAEIKCYILSFLDDFVDIYIVLGMLCDKTHKQNPLFASPRLSLRVFRNLAMQLATDPNTFPHAQVPPCYIDYVKQPTTPATSQQLSPNVLPAKVFNILFDEFRFCDFVSKLSKRDLQSCGVVDFSNLSLYDWCLCRLLEWYITFFKYLRKNTNQIVKAGRPIAYKLKPILVSASKETDSPDIVPTYFVDIRIFTGQRSLVLKFCRLCLIFPYFSSNIRALSIVTLRQRHLCLLLPDKQQLRTHNQEQQQERSWVSDLSPAIKRCPTRATSCENSPYGSCSSYGSPSPSRNPSDQRATFFRTLSPSDRGNRMKLRHNVLYSAVRASRTSSPWSVASTAASPGDVAELNLLSPTQPAIAQPSCFWDGKIKRCRLCGEKYEHSRSSCNTCSCVEWREFQKKKVLSKSSGSYGEWFRILKGSRLGQEQSFPHLRYFEILGGGSLSWVGHLMKGNFPKVEVLCVQTFNEGDTQNNHRLHEKPECIDDLLEDYKVPVMFEKFLTLFPLVRHLRIVVKSTLPNSPVFQEFGRVLAEVLAKPNCLLECIDFSQTECSLHFITQEIADAVQLFTAVQQRESRIGNFLYPTRPATESSQASSDFSSIVSNTSAAAPYPPDNPQSRTAVPSTDGQYSPLFEDRVTYDTQEAASTQSSSIQNNFICAKLQCLSRLQSVARNVLDIIKTTSELVQLPTKVRLIRLFPEMEEFMRMETENRLRCLKVPEFQIFNNGSFSKQLLQDLNKKYSFSDLTPLSPSSSSFPLTSQRPIFSDLSAACNFKILGGRYGPYWLAYNVWEETFRVFPDCRVEMPLFLSLCPRVELYIG